MAIDEQSERGASLVGTLVVLLILGGLAVVVLKAWPGESGGTSATLRDLTSEANLAGGGAPVGAGAPRSPMSGASVAACTATVRSVEQAAAAMRTSAGAFPASISDLVTGHWLSEAPATPGYALTMAEVGGQRNGKVLVNGLPSEQGCAAPPRVIP